jgi:glycosidase
MLRSDETKFTGFHVSTPARDRYQFELDLYTEIGKIAVPTFHTARLVAARMNEKRDLVSFPEQAIRASQINAIALIQGITQHVFRSYREQHFPQLLAQSLERLRGQFGGEKVDQALGKFAEQFPPLDVYLRDTTAQEFLEASSYGVPNREVVLEELLLLWVSNSNPAFSPFLELFGDDLLEQETIYNRAMNDLYTFFGTNAKETGAQGRFPAGENIIDFLLAPVRASPHSLEGQLEFLLARWGDIIGTFAYRLLRSMDLIKEETKPVFFGPGPVGIPDYDITSLEMEGERFTADKEWMPRVVMIAKSAFVWLDQLSKKYGKPITTLDQIPDAELDQLAAWGITGLWLIGLWERSKASKTIKVWTGNPEAVASAYSLLDYQIAADLGGEAACNDLKARAWKRGIRLASDMVPNHVGIDGRWVIEHPDWFVQLPYSPFPSYTFNSADLSWDERVGVFVEDHYYDRTDAAVVFKRLDRWTGEERYIYHGNDGTSIPWVDTAQLNYLNPDVREAMVQLILHIARQFPIIRFDAAMTLVKKHFHRLWFPEPGSGGAIPSRAEHGMSKAQFDALMPEEFWREVVDRAAVEAPDTLLLAEAFWLMEGYFVRTLGMHRVYNSAFMNILRDEENANYRLVMKNTLEFDPEIMRRYVNFMSNPDERTAVEQFGKDDKYFGVCTLMITMPGLPMFGHGQIEGFTEKYGMEYRRAYFDEQPDQWLIQRQEREIFPLARKRYLFAGVDNFLLYDFFAPDGGVNENVFAYSNRYGDETALVVYNNVYGSAQGWIRTSVGFMARTGNGDERAITQKTLGEGLGLSSNENEFCIYRDFRSGLEYIRSSRELWEQGMYFELGAYQNHVFLDFRIVTDTPSGQYRHLAAYLGGRGAPSINEALQEIFVQPIREPFEELVNAEMFQRLLDARVTKAGKEVDTPLLDEVEEKTDTLLRTIAVFLGTEAEPVPAQLQADDADDPEEDDLSASMARHVRSELAAALRLSTPKHALLSDAVEGKKALDGVQEALEDESAWGGLFAWIFVHALGEIGEDVDRAGQSRSWIDEWLLGRRIKNTLVEIGIDDDLADRIVTGIKVATAHQRVFEGHLNERADVMLTRLLQDADVQKLLRVNRFQDVLWFDKEGFEQLLNWLLLINAVMASSGPTPPDPAIIAARYHTVEQLRQAAAKSGYQVEKLRTALTASRPQTVGGA